MTDARTSNPPMTAISARYDHRIRQVVIELECGLFLSFRPKDVQGLEKATREDLRRIEISPSGQGIHFPSLDADIHIPSLLQGVRGSQEWLSSHRAR